MKMIVFILGAFVNARQISTNEEFFYGLLRHEVSSVSSEVANQLVKN